MPCMFLPSQDSITPGCLKPHPHWMTVMPFSITIIKLFLANCFLNNCHKSNVLVLNLWPKMIFFTEKNLFLSLLLILGRFAALDIEVISVVSQ